jgi:hypothetical protein
VLKVETRSTNYIFHNTKVDYVFNKQEITPLYIVLSSVEEAEIGNANNDWVY